MIELNQRYEIKITPIHFIYSKSKEGIFKSIFIIHKLYIRYDIHKFETGLISRLRRNPRGTSFHSFFFRPPIGIN